MSKRNANLHQGWIYDSGYALTTGREREEPGVMLPRLFNDVSLDVNLTRKFKLASPKPLDGFL